ncbi:MAG: MqnA/MqnD/SBP family protein [Planctomycetota bacterium]|nr:MqnA/MqnD/SBP family protein [Planctomycetota bacterium]
MPTRIHLGLSTCPNDTYLAHALLTGAVETPGLELDIEFMDVQRLNERLAQGDFDVAKASYHLALRHAGELLAMPTGSALGFGNGPLLLARSELTGTLPGPASRVLCPGEDTTATLLYRLFHAGGAAPEQRVFSEIMPALEAGEADFGVCIHEGRFTYEESGLVCVEDLGASWEAATSCPLPLGGLFARRSLDEAVMDAVQDALSRSIRYADDHREETLTTMRAHAQELDDSVIWSHVELYVNGWTRRLGPEGRRAIAQLAERAAGAGILAPGHALEIFEPFARRRLFHAVPAGAAGVLEALGEVRPTSLDEEGFVHLSQAQQLEGTLEVHFRGVDRVLLLELDPEKVAADVRFEPSRGGALFPHLFRPIDLVKDVIGRTTLCRGRAGRFELPEGITPRR